jgi:hypothetical protein
MRTIKVAVPHPEIYGGTVEHDIEVDDDYASRVVASGHGTYVDGPEPTEATATEPDAAAVPDAPAEAAEAATPAAADEGDPAVRVRRTTRADAPAA